MSNDGRIVILTATYNHKEKLKRLYHSLLEQENKDFRWIIVDDGSDDGTGETVSEFSGLTVEYFRKTNSGKSSTLNSAFDRINDEDMAVIVDDDEILDPTAVSILKAYYQRYYGTETGVLHFHRRNTENGEIIANYEIKEDLKLDYREFKTRGLSADGYLCYFGYAIKNLRFPAFPGEKYVGPSVMMMMAGNTYSTIWAKEAIGTTEYLEGGITRQGRALRVKSPLGMMVYCMLYQSPKSGGFIRLKYSLEGYAYQYYSGISTCVIRNAGIQIDKLNPLTRLPGMLLGNIWKRKYPKP